MMLDKLKKVFVKGVVAPVPILEQQTFHLGTEPTVTLDADFIGQGFVQQNSLWLPSTPYEAITEFDWKQHYTNVTIDGKALEPEIPEGKVKLYGGPKHGDVLTLAGAAHTVKIVKLAQVDAADPPGAINWVTGTYKMIELQKYEWQGWDDGSEWVPEKPAVATLSAAWEAYQQSQAAMAKVNFNHRTAGDVLGELVPALNEYTSRCPVEELGRVCLNAMPVVLSYLIQHLNDHHHWTRERIADWLETLPVDLTFTSASKGD